MKIKKGDNVFIVKGKNKGSKGKVLRVFPAEQKIIVEGMNLRKKHIRPKKQGEKGQMIEQPAPLSVSNVKMICPKCSKPSRFGFTIIGDKKYRVCKSCKGEI